MKRTLEYRITQEQAGLSVKDFLRSKGYSRHLLIQIKYSDKCILLNDSSVRLNTILQVGDIIWVDLPEEISSEHIPPADLPLSIVYEDEDLMVLNKPYDMPIHPSIGNYENTLANALAWYFQKKGESFVFRCINRLDRDTSGLLIVAKNALSGAVLSDQMKQRNIHRTYLAVVKGIPQNSGVIRAPIARADDSVIQRCIDYGKGESAVTHFKRLCVSADKRYSLLSVRLETGRTHQIRVHMKHIGHPLPGDFLYCPEYEDFTRQPLHSYSLEFTHPITGVPMTFSSEMPSDLHPEFFNI